MHYRDCFGCELCGISKLTTTKITNRHTLKLKSLVNPLLFVGDNPSEIDDACGLPFTDKPGKLLDRLLDEAGVTHFVLTNAILCTPYNEKRTSIREPSDEEIENCSKHLRLLLQKLEPSGVVLLGKIAIKAYEAAVGVKLKSKDIASIPHHIIELPTPLSIMLKGGVDTVEFKRASLKLKHFYEGIHGEKATS
jgi:uracil-DNA glycosylase family 4